MWNPALEAEWQRLTEEILTGVKEWRLQHPRATLREIEQAVDERLAGARARLLQEAALASAATEPGPGDPSLRCPDCGEPLRLEGRATRHLTTSFAQDLTLTRRYARCPACGAGLFPPR